MSIETPKNPILLNFLQNQSFVLNDRKKNLQKSRNVLSKNNFLNSHNYQNWNMKNIPHKVQIFHSILSLESNYQKYNLKNH
jgi:hypothetical protein